MELLEKMNKCEKWIKVVIIVGLLFFLTLSFSLGSTTRSVRSNIGNIGLPPQAVQELRKALNP